MASVPDSVALQFFLYSIISTVNLVHSDFMWLRGTLSIKAQQKKASILEILKSDLFPSIAYEVKEFSVDIPIINIQQWYEKHQDFSEPEIADILHVYQCDFGLNSGKDSEVFRLLQAIELISRHEVREFAIPERQVVNQSRMASKLKEAEETEKKRREATASLQAKLKSIDL